MPRIILLFSFGLKIFPKGISIFVKTAVIKLLYFVQPAKSQISQCIPNP